jgi:hypothetical protein
VEILAVFIAGGKLEVLNNCQDDGLMDLIIIVVVIGALISLVVVMFRYAGFIHQGPASGNPEKKLEKDETDNSSSKDKV